MSEINLNSFFEQIRLEKKTAPRPSGTACSYCNTVVKTAKCLNCGAPKASR